MDELIFFHTQTSKYRLSSTYLLGIFSAYSQHISSHKLELTCLQQANSTSLYAGYNLFK